MDRCLHDYSPLPSLEQIARLRIGRILFPHFHGTEVHLIELLSGTGSSVQTLLLQYFNFEVLPSYLNSSLVMRDISLLFFELQRAKRKLEITFENVVFQQLAWSPYGSVNLEESYPLVKEQLERTEYFRYASKLCKEEDIRQFSKQELEPIRAGCYYDLHSIYWIDQIAYDTHDQLYLDTSYKTMFSCSVMMGLIPAINYFFDKIKESGKQPLEYLINECPDVSYEGVLYIMSIMSEEEQHLWYKKSNADLLMGLAKLWPYRKSFLLILNNLLKSRAMTINSFLYYSLYLINSTMAATLRFGDHFKLFYEMWTNAPDYYTSAPNAIHFLRRIIMHMFYPSEKEETCIIESQFPDGYLRRIYYAPPFEMHFDDSLGTYIFDKS